MHIDLKEKGELVVSGHDKAHIPLSHRPHRVHVRFEEQAHHPCNPDHHHQHDRVSWEIDDDGIFGHKYVLTIKWHVHHGTREVSWKVEY